MLKGKGLLTPLERDFLRLFSQLPDQANFFLAGGTALAEFYLGHRLSYDLDMFTSERDLILPFSHQLESACQVQGIEVKVVRRFATFVELLIQRSDETLRVDLGLDSPYHVISPVVSEYGVRVNSFEDMKADKLLAYFGRSEPRDAIDVFFLLQKEPLETLIAVASEKDPGFDLYWFAMALNRAQNFPDELERWPVRMLQDFSPKVLKQTFSDMAIKIMKQLEP
ncbi:MAG TPA: nucleotidyl transferase AbiEii/AbiGii toxin family protein [Anaerolineales bacterium]|nr:nucleotidyl transferase AbiEii/AbiGii toxin family protein [Anaerolineales bacterium]